MVADRPGDPAVELTFPGAGSHQYVNARYLEEKKACYVVDQKNFSFDKVKGFIEKLLDNKEEILRIRDNLRKLDICVSCKEFCKNFI